MSIRVLLVDDHAILREGVRRLLEMQGDLEVVGEAADGVAAVEMATALTPHVVVMDIAMPELNGIEATRRIVARCPGVRVIALSIHSNRAFMAEMLRAGAAGYLVKTATCAELVWAIHAVFNGQVYLSPAISGAVVDGFVRHVPADRTAAFSALSPREREVLQLVAEGRTTKLIAARLHVSAKTVEAHRAQIMGKLHIHSIAGLTKFAVHEGITSPEPLAD
jgi:DNA-binding NarL/FixJ family response regulator